MSLALSIDNVSKTYGDREVLRGCSHSFGRGVTALMGANGSGKSTLLRICALLEAPTNGSVVYRNENGRMTDGTELRRRITLVLPHAGIFNTSVFSNAAYGLRVRGIKKSMVSEKTDAVLKSVGLLEKRRQPAHSLSSGEARRLSIARAMAIEPDVMLLDEPTASVDEENTETIEAIILGLAMRPKPPTILLTTHDRAQAERLADGIVLISRGEINNA
jgi:tungstate transport system ATP-binding protein